MKDFADLLLIQDIHNHWEALFEENNIKANRKFMQFNQTTLAIDAAANGQGICLAPRLLIENDLKRKQMKEIWRDERTNQKGFYILWPKGAKSNPAIKSVLNWLLSEVADNSETGENNAD